MYFTDRLKFFSLCLPEVRAHFAASAAIHFFLQVWANPLSIFSLFHKTGWASLAVLLNGYSPVPCCLRQPWGASQSQIWNLAALALGAPISIPRGTEDLPAQGTSTSEAAWSLLWQPLAPLQEQSVCIELFLTLGQPDRLFVLTLECVCKSRP